MLELIGYAFVAVLGAMAFAIVVFTIKELFNV